MNILVTGGCGYKGSVLVKKLLRREHNVIVVDTLWFGSFLEDHPCLKIIKKDIREISVNDLENIDVVVHLASVANDPSAELDPVLSYEVNVFGTMKLIDAAVCAGVKQFIFFFFGSVYGIKEEKQVTEDLSLVPISKYNITKMIGERILFSYQDKIILQCIRPATVCGLSPRMRFDLSVNMLTIQALTTGKIKVFGGKQIRPNIHIEDITDLYIYFIDSAGKYTGVYNAGFENLSILEIAEKVRSYVPADIEILHSNDPRSYRLDSTKLLSTSYRPKRTVDDAIKEIIDAYNLGILKDDERCYNVKWMKKQLKLM